LLFSYLFVIYLRLWNGYWSGVILKERIIDFEFKSNHIVYPFSDEKRGRL